MSKPRVLIVCTGNSMRSQLAEALLRQDLGRHIDVFSAGTHPGYVHPLTLESLRQIGIDTSPLHSKGIREFLDQELDLVITVCDHARENCPFVPGAKRTIHVGYEDPITRAGMSDAQERMNELRDRMREELRKIVISELSLRI